MATIQFKTTVARINGHDIIALPKAASEQLPSRGQVMVRGTINGVDFRIPLEPDGRWSHWFPIDTSLREAVAASVGDTVEVELQPTKEWIEPEVPADLQGALVSHPRAAALWQIITPMARWEWVRWTRSTSNPETRKRRIEVACSKLTAGKRRPCCWNRNLCTEPAVSKSGILLEPQT